MNINLYMNYSEPIKVDKNLTNEISLQGTLRDECNILRPVVLIQTTTNLSQYNYCYIPEFARYYYIEVESVRNGVWRIICKVDVLMSWRIHIRQNSAVISRNENVYNLYLQDDAFKASSKRSIQTKAFDYHFNTIPDFVIAFGGGGIGA